MTTEREIYATARLLIRGYGEGARLLASQRCDEMIEDSDAEGLAAWLRILAALEDLAEAELGGEPKH